MKFSVAICTWNRSELLARTLNSICELNIPDALQWELVLVDNHSTDNTAEVLTTFSGRLPLRIFHESRPGHSAARNRAVEHCRGEITLWTDDDVSVHSDWLVHYSDAIGQTPDASFWGGPIRPNFDIAPPSWVNENWEICKGCFAIRELGPKVVPFMIDRLPYGANFAVRTSLLREFRFDEQRGHRRGLLLGDDELDLMRRLISAGHSGYWVPDAVVEHLIPAERLTLEYVRKYFVGQGYRLGSAGENADRSASSLRRESLVQRSLFRLKYSIARSPVWFSHLVRSALADGQYQFRMARNDNAGGQK